MPKEQLTRTTDAQVMIASSYRRPTHKEQTSTASVSFEEMGKSVYPPANSIETVINSGFILAEGTTPDKEQNIANNLQRVERDFLEGVRDAELVYVIAANGYLGKSAVVETVYAMASGTPLLFSEPIQHFGNEVPESMKSIVQKNSDKHVYLPISDLSEDNISHVLEEREEYDISDNEKARVLIEIAHLMKDLKPKKADIGVLVLNQEMDYAEATAGFLYRAIMERVTNYPEFYDEAEKEFVEQVARKEAQIAKLEVLGLAGADPVKHIGTVIKKYKKEFEEEGNGDLRFHNALDSLAEWQATLAEQIRQTIISPEGTAYDQGDMLLSLFSDESDSDRRYEGVHLMTFAPNEEIIIKRLLSDFGVKERYSYDRSFGFMQNRPVEEIPELKYGLSGLQTDIDGVSCWIYVQPPHISQVQFGLSFDYKAKRLTARALDKTH